MTGSVCLLVAVSIDVRPSKWRFIDCHIMGLCGGWLSRTIAGPALSDVHLNSQPCIGVSEWVKLILIINCNISKVFRPLAPKLMAFWDTQMGMAADNGEGLGA